MVNRAQEAVIARKRALVDAKRYGMVGKRNEWMARARALVEVAGARVDELVAGDPEFIEKFVTELKAGATDRREPSIYRTCTNAIMMILKKMNTERVLLVEYVRQLGASSEEEARKAVEAYRSADGADVLTAIERCTAFLEGALPMHEQHRAMVIRRLGGYLPVDSSRVGADEEPIPGA